jgi:hypothetical protein
LCQNGLIIAEFANSGQAVFSPVAQQAENQ